MGSTVPIRLELSKDEHGRVKAAAALSGQSLADWCREQLVKASDSVLGQQAKPQPTAKANR